VKPCWFDHSATNDPLLEERNQAALKQGTVGQEDALLVARWFQIPQPGAAELPRLFEIRRSKM
jgi:hypothetical protein